MNPTNPAIPNPTNVMGIEKDKKILKILHLPIMDWPGKENVSMKNFVIPTHIGYYVSLLISGHSKWCQKDLLKDHLPTPWIKPKANVRTVTPPQTWWLQKPINPFQIRVEFRKMGNINYYKGLTYCISLNMLEYLVRVGERKGSWKWKKIKLCNWLNYIFY